MRWDAPVPGEGEAGERSWPVVCGAYEERIPCPRPRRRWPIVALVAALAIAAAVLSPPGMAVLDSLRDAVRGASNARPGLDRLPTAGRLLVKSPAGAWIVQRDGSKRLLSGYRDPSWSPHGLFLAAARRNQLVALEPNGRVHWSLARSRPVGAPRWSYEGFRIAYVTGSELRIVNGDGTGDRLLVPRVGTNPQPRYEWRPGTHVLAYIGTHDDLVFVDVDRNRVLGVRPARHADRLLWSDDGQRLLLVAGRATVLDARGRKLSSAAVAGVPVGAAFLPRSHSFALAGATGTRSVVDVIGARGRRRIFSGAGFFGEINWSPDGRWLLVDWKSADQWLFVRSTAVRKVKAFSDIAATFHGGVEAGVAPAGWCCP